MKHFSQSKGQSFRFHRSKEGKPVAKKVWKISGNYTTFKRLST